MAQQQPSMRSDSTTSRRIVHAFLDFLNSVEPAPGVDLEGLEVAKDCLTEVFRLHQLPDSERPEPNLLVNIFNSQENGSKSESKGSPVEDLNAVPSAQNQAAVDSARTSQIQGDVTVRESDDSGVSKDELFGHYFDALEKSNFFRTTPNGDDEHALLDRATSLFHDAVNEMGRSGCKFLDRKSLANALKTLGNKAMQSGLYSDAIECYTCAIALCRDNAVFYCNRAAAYTQLHKYNEAVTDALRSIEIDPSYSKAYSRLGLAYYGQGKYSDAINKGLRKALELDPNNDTVKENIRVAEQKLQEQERRNEYQDPRGHFTGGSASFPINLGSLFGNMAGSASQNQNGQSRAAEDNHGTHTSDGNAVPIDIQNISVDLASTVMNVARAFHGSDSENRTAEQAQESEASHPFSSMPGTLPSDFAGMFTNMTGQGSQRQSARGQTRASSNVGGSDDSGFEGTANFTFNLGGGSTDELNMSFPSAFRMFPRGNGDAHQ